jgi:poly-gamma-glutamate synthesis protein (capsule biosynthesis protein)
MIKQQYKITFTGDLMCDMCQIPAHKTKTGEYDFSEIFKDCKEYFSSSDYVVGNLETPIANVELSSHITRFNSPIEYAEAVKNSGISMVTTANNHCLDKGISGLEDTIANLDVIGLKHTGTNNRNIIPTGIVETIGDIKIGFLSYTYGTNACYNNLYLNKNEKWKVNLYQEQELHNPIYRRFHKSKILAFIKKSVNYCSRRLLHRDIFSWLYEGSEKNARLLKRMKQDIQALKSVGGAEYVIMCLHVGGQYNAKPQKYAKKIIAQIASMGVDAIIGNHEHVIHYGEVLSNKVIAYSLGNFTGRTGVHKPPYDKMAEYSILFNLYLSKDDKAVKPVYLTFSIAKSVSDGENRVKTVLLFDLIKKCTDADERDRLLFDNLKAYNLFTNKKETEIELKLEYSINERNDN